MFQIITIQPTSSSGDSGEIRYEIHVRLAGDTLIFPAEVRPGPHGPQLDWSDEFQDLLMTHEADFPAVNLLLFQVHSGEAVAFPVALGSAA